MFVKDRCANYITLKSNISKNGIKKMYIFVKVIGASEKSLQFELFFSLTTSFAFSKGALLCPT